MRFSLRLPLLDRWFATRTPGGEWMQLRHRQVYILPTRYGLLLGAVVLALVAGSINYGLSLGYVLAFWLVGLGLVSMLHTWRNLAGLEVASGYCPPVCAGQMAAPGLRLDSGGRARYALRLRFERGGTQTVDVPESASARVTAGLPAIRRGWLAAGRLRLSTTYPLGLFTAWSWVLPECRCLVYPRPEQDAPPLPPGSGTGLRGPAMREGQDDFLGLRAWRPGDSPRRVDWKASARGQTVLSKMFIEDGGNALLLDWEELRGLDVESRLSRLTRWVLDAEASRRPYALRLPGQEFPPDLGGAHREACLTALALYGLK